MRQPNDHFPTLCLLPIAICIASSGAKGEDTVTGIAERTPWHNTRLVGSPEPPLPYSTEPVFTDVDWDRPIYAKAEPGTPNVLVVLQGGEKDRPTRILRLNEKQPDQVTEFFRLERFLVYGLAFDPAYSQNRFVYLFMNGPTGEPERTNRIVRYQLRDDADRTCDPDSELVILQWRSMGHDGGELGFGKDGMLYISSGDGTSDSDGWLSGQDITNLLGGVLRIDVRQASPDQPYQIPSDNPFLDIDGARGEVWAFGLRNPWRLWCDPQSGQVWVGNNGQDLWESVHLIRRGENYGWSVYEGSHPFYPQRQRGPAAIVPPTLEHHHTEARSLTGGVVYRGSRHPELDGAYIYGDYSTGKIWGVRHDGSNVTWHQELADTALQIAGFAISPSGALLIVDHGGALHRLIQSPPVQSPVPFPRLLSETELFESVADHRPAPGILPYSVNAPGWHDGAVAERFLAIPSDDRIDAGGNRGWDLPNGSVLIQTLSLPTSSGQQRMETRLLVRQQNEWAGYSYRWNDEQTDAELVGRSGIEITRPDVNSTSVPWHIPSRAECMSCHSRAVNFVLGLSAAQMNRSHRYDSVTADQLATLEHIGLFERSPTRDQPTLVDPYHETHPIDARARSYLHVNCSGCHVEAGGGNARMELEFHRSLDEMRVVSARPQHATFQIPDAMIVAPGQPERSVLFQRISRRGAGQMPPLFTHLVDAAGRDLIGQWIAGLPRNERPFVRAWNRQQLVASLDKLNEARSLESGEKLYRDLGCIQCHRFNEEGGGAGPELTKIASQRTAVQIVESIADPSATIAPEYALTLLSLSDGTSLSGRVEYEDEQVLRLRSPESFDQPITINQSEIEARRQSNVSMMPADMLNTCSEEEILDLLAYLLSAGGPPRSDTP